MLQAFIWWFHVVRMWRLNFSANHVHLFRQLYEGASKFTNSCTSLKCYVFYVSVQTISLVSLLQIPCSNSLGSYTKWVVKSKEKKPTLSLLFVYQTLWSEHAPAKEGSGLTLTSWHVVMAFCFARSRFRKQFDAKRAKCVAARAPHDWTFVRRRTTGLPCGAVR
jgi:hypothetical protein